MNEMNRMKTLVSSEEVEGTAVYSRDSRESIGEIHHLMIDKLTGEIAYADMSFGGFLGLGQSHYPIPWKALDYDPDLGGFTTSITQRQLESAPQASGRDWWDDRDHEVRIHDHYGTAVYWGAAGGIDTSAAVEATRALDREQADRQRRR